MQTQGEWIKVFGNINIAMLVSSNEIKIAFSQRSGV
jgi:hypothetical protein